MFVSSTWVLNQRCRPLSSQACAAVPRYVKHQKKTHRTCVNRDRCRSWHFKQDRSSLSCEKIFDVRQENEVQEARRQQARERFYAEVHKPEKEIDLGKVAIYICQEEFPDVEENDIIAALDEIAALVEPRIPETRYPLKVIQAINDVLYTELGFLGDKKHFYNWEYGYINRVLVLKRGFTISLCILYLEISKRVGFPMVPVGLPHHMLIRPQSSSPDLDIYVDPFYAGHLFFRHDCYREMAEIYGVEEDDERVRDPKYLEPIAATEVILRLLRHLKEIAMFDRHNDKALRLTERLVLMGSMYGPDHRDRGKLLFRSGRRDLALAPLEMYLSLCPDARDVHLIYEMVRDIRAGQGRTSSS